MKQMKRAKVVALLLALIAFSFFTLSIARVSAHTASTTAFWVQTIDSCRQAIPGAKFVLIGNGLRVREGPAPGTKPVKVGAGSCPIQRGNCLAVPTGCLMWNIPVPVSGTLTYKVKESVAPPGYLACTGGSVCPDGNEVATLIIDSTGAIMATVTNVYPDETQVIWPTSGLPYAGTPTDPAVFHDFQLGSGSCDGDTDADDHLTGTPSSHCDSDLD